jgi:anti-sigma B factor antagonist
MKEKLNLSAPEFHHEGTELKIHTRVEEFPNLPEDGVIVDISGDLNLYSTPHVKNILNRLVDSGKLKIYLNLDGLNYIDSSGLGAFLGAQSRLMKMRGFLKLCAPAKQVMAVLELTKLKSMLRVSRTLEDGVNSKI